MDYKIYNVIGKKKVLVAQFLYHYEAMQYLNKARKDYFNDKFIGRKKAFCVDLGRYTWVSLDGF